MNNLNIHYVGSLQIEQIQIDKFTILKIKSVSDKGDEFTINYYMTDEYTVENRLELKEELKNERTS